MCGLHRLIENFGGGLELRPIPQLPLDSRNQRSEGLIARVDDEMGAIAVEGIPDMMQFFQFRQWIGGAQKGAIAVVASSEVELARRSTQIDNRSGFMQCRAILWIDDRTSARGEHDVGLPNEVLHD